MTELRFHVVTLLAGVYLLAWHAMFRPAPSPPQPPSPPPPPAAAAAREVQVIYVPPGWRVAGTATPAPTADTPRRVQPAPRKRRVRTRSS